MGVRTWEPSEEPPLPPLGPSPWTAIALALLLFLGLVSNGRPIGSRQTQAAEQLAVGLAAGRLEREDPVPLLPSLLAAPLFAAARSAFAVEDSGRALAGKLAASLLSAFAAGALFLALGWRRPETEAATTAALFALGTGVWAASQALWPQPAALLFLCLTLLCVARAEHGPGWASVAGLPLGLAVAADPSVVALGAVLILGIAGRWPRRLLGLVFAALPGAAVFVLDVLRPDGAFPLLERAGPAPGAAHLALLFSPAQGWLVFTPLVVVAAAGLVRAFARGERWLAATLGVAVLAHWAFVGSLASAQSGGFWGPRLMTDAVPLLLFFLPEGFDALGRMGGLLAALSVAIQTVGAFGDGRRWERLYGPLPNASVTWDLAHSPITLLVSERVLRPAAPTLSAGKVAIREHPIVVLGPRGSRITFSSEGPVLKGAEDTCGDVHLRGGARVQGSRLQLAAADDALFLRVTPAARLRSLELRILGRGRGTLRVSEATFWSEPRVKSYAIAGAFRFRQAYEYPESGGPDITISVTGEAMIESVSLVAPSEADDPIEAPG